MSGSFYKCYLKMRKDNHDLHDFFHQLEGRSLYRRLPGVNNGVFNDVLIVFQQQLEHPTKTWLEDDYGTRYNTQITIETMPETEYMPALIVLLKKILSFFEEDLLVVYYGDRDLLRRDSGRILANPQIFSKERFPIEELELPICETGKLTR